jgi:RNA recognition motif. (a.k.a. RRM, RBD, or RNP domain)
MCALCIVCVALHNLQQRVKVVFQRCGRIESVRIRAEKGFGFVTFLTEKVTIIHFHIVNHPVKHYNQHA